MIVVCWQILDILTVGFHLLLRCSRIKCNVQIVVRVIDLELFGIGVNEMEMLRHYATLTSA